MPRKKIYDDLPERSHPDYMKLYAEKNKEKLKQHGKQYRLKRLEENPNYYKEKYKKEEANYKKWKKENKHIVAEKQWKKIGILDMSYDKFLKEMEKQKNCCLICSRELKNPQVDHNHTTGKYRGILCVPCNNGLGIYEKNKNRFEKYLEETK